MKKIVVADSRQIDFSLTLKPLRRNVDIVAIWLLFGYNVLQSYRH